MTAGRTAVGARKAALAKGRRKRVVFIVGGLSLRSAVRGRGGANCCWKASWHRIDALEKSMRPVEMRGDGVAGGGRRCW